MNLVKWQGEFASTKTYTTIFGEVRECEFKEGNGVQFLVVRRGEDKPAKAGNVAYWDRGTSQSPVYLNQWPPSDPISLSARSSWVSGLRANTVALYSEPEGGWS